MPECMECFAGHHGVSFGGMSLLDAAAQQPVGMLMLAFLVFYALLTASRRLADRIDPPRVERRPVPVEVPPPPRVWRFRSGARGGI